MIATKAERTCRRKTRQTSATTSASSISLCVEVLDRALDQRRAVVDRDDLDALRQAAPDLLELPLHAADDVERVLAGAHDDDAADDFALCR